MFAVVLIAVLATLAIPGIANARRTSREKEARLDLDMLASAIDELAWDTGEWPGGIARNRTSSAETWDLTGGAAGIIENDGRFSNWQGPYIRTVGLDPWGQPYFFDPDYRINGEWRMVVGSFGPNRRGRNAYDADDLYVILN